MQKTALFVAALILILISIGCGLGFQPDGVGGYVLIPWRDANGNYPFQKVQLLSVESPRSLQSYRAKVYYRTGADSAGFTGNVVKPNIAQKGDLWIPLDAKSGLSISAFAIMERIYDFDKKMESLTSLRWPRSIGVEILVRTQEGSLTNNALYDMDLDVIAIAPYHISNTPVALNPGILAHEHFHAHFASAWKGKEPAESPMRINGKNAIASVNLAVLSGWNEGLADYYGFVFTGDQDFMRSTFALKADDRRLDGALLPIYPWQHLYNEMGCAAGLCKFGTNHLGYSYHNGTAIARLLYRWGALHQDGHARLMAHIQRRLPVVMDRIRNGLETYHLSPALLLEDLIATSNMGLSSELCSELFWITSQVSPAPYYGKCQ